MQEGSIRQEQPEVPIQRGDFCAAESQTGLKLKKLTLNSTVLRSLTTFYMEDRDKKDKDKDDGEKPGQCCQDSQGTCSIDKPPKKDK
jgi:hypothetical protein